MNRFPDFIKEAHARYPDEPLELALHFLASDRRTAGLGALDITKRLRRESGGYRFVSNTKQMHALDGTVLYQMSVHRLSRFECPQLDEPVSIGAAGAEFVTMTRIPGGRSDRWLPVNPRDLWTERGRSLIALTLRKIRREMRRELDQ